MRVALLTFTLFIPVNVLTSSAHASWDNPTVFIGATDPAANYNSRSAGIDPFSGTYYLAPASYSWNVGKNNRSAATMSSEMSGSDRTVMATTGYAGTQMPLKVTEDRSIPNHDSVPYVSHLLGVDPALPWLK